MMNELEIFAKRLRQARIKEKLSMDALCQKMEGVVSKQAVSKYEAAKMLPSSTILIALADALKVNLDYFFQPFRSDVLEIERYLEIEEILGKEPIIYNKVEVLNSSHYQTLVYQALEQQLITTSKAAAMLNCSVADVRNKMNGN